METDSKKRTKKEILREQNEEFLDSINEVIERLENWQAETESYIEEIDEMKEEDITEEQMEEEEENFHDVMALMDKIRELVY